MDRLDRPRMTGRFRWASPFDHLGAPRLDIIRLPPELPPFFPVVFPRMCGACGSFKSWSFTSRRRGASAIGPVTETHVLTIRLSYLTIEKAGSEYPSQHLVGGRFRDAGRLRWASVSVGRFFGGVCFPLNSFVHLLFQRAFSSTLTFYAFTP